MPSLKQIYFASVLVLALLSTTAAQDTNSPVSPGSSLTITAAAAGDAVRITAPSSIVQMQVEVYAAGGERVFDQKIRGGNVFDWHLQDSQAQRLTPGAYVCVVTAKNVSGRLTQKLGTVVVAEKSVGVPAGSIQLSLQQSQAIGPVAADSWTIAAENEPQTPTVIAHDGTDGQMIRGRGALTFRIGNFFSGIDTEQMRLTEAGDLGIGTSTPRSKLDVAGVIRAERFLVVKPGTSGNNKTAAAPGMTESANSVQPLVGGTGTTGQLTKWTDGANGILGDSSITQTAGGNVGIGTTSPSSYLHSVAGLAIYGAAASGISLANDGTGDKDWLLYTLNDDLYLYESGASHATGNDRVSFKSGGNVGIGTASPGGKLEVFGAGQQIKLTGATTTDAFVGASGTKLFLTDWATAAKGVIVDMSNGNVGIGTTAPATRLHVNGGDILLNTTLGNAIELGSPNSETGLSIIKTNIGRADLRFDGSTLKLVTGAANSGPPSGINGLVINSGGNVGIGVADPFAAKLQVETSTSTFDAILGKSNSGYGVHGESLEGAGVFGRSNSGIGVSGESNTVYGVYGASTSGPGVVARTNTGNIIEGYRFARVFHIDNVGTYVGGSDFAEALPVRGDRADYEPGDVLVVSTKAPGKVEKASRPNDPQVAGIYSTRPGMLGADKLGTSRVDADEVPVAIVGIVPTKVSTENGPILIGDLLTTSSTPGYAMKASPVRVCRVKVYRAGTILGKALEPLKQGKGVIKVLVTLR